MSSDLYENENCLDLAFGNYLILDKDKEDGVGKGLADEYDKGVLSDWISKNKKIDENKDENKKEIDDFKQKVLGKENRVVLPPESDKVSVLKYAGVGAGIGALVGGIAGAAVGGVLSGWNPVVMGFFGGIGAFVGAVIGGIVGAIIACCKNKPPKTRESNNINIDNKNENELGLIRVK